MYKGYVLTLNQRVQGSSPCAPTIDVATLSSVSQQNKTEQRGAVGRSVGSFCSPFELANGAFGERWIAVEVMGIEDRADVRQAVAGDGRYLRLGTPSKRQTGNGGAAEVIEGDTDDARFLARLAPG